YLPFANFAENAALAGRTEQEFSISRDRECIDVAAMARELADDLARLRVDQVHLAITRRGDEVSARNLSESIDRITWHHLRSDFRQNQILGTARLGRLRARINPTPNRCDLVSIELLALARRHLDFLPVALDSLLD